MTAWNPKTDPPFLPPLNPRISAAEYQAALGAKPKRRHKYGVSAPGQRTAEGILFDSAAECRRYGELKLLERGGFIRDLRRQTKFTFTIDGDVMFSYVSDFDYWEGCTYKIEDVKGVKTPVYRLKKKLIERQHGIKITEVA